MLYYYRHYSKQLRINITEIAVTQSRLQDSVAAALPRHTSITDMKLVIWQLQADVIYGTRIVSTARTTLRSPTLSSRNDINHMVILHTNTMLQSPVFFTFPYVYAYCWDRYSVRVTCNLRVISLIFKQSYHGSPTVVAANHYWSHSVAYALWYLATAIPTTPIHHSYSHASCHLNI